jgi:hypothetical protein
MITAKKLIKLGFERKEIQGQEYYEKENYILKSELGKWLICSRDDGIITTTLFVIETEKELEKHYKESTKKSLK